MQQAAGLPRNLVRMLFALLIAIASAHNPFTLRPTELPSSADVPEELEFDQWATLFQRHYPTDAERAHRRAVFGATLAFIRQHNAAADAGVHSYRCGVNAMSDLTAEEYRQRLGLVPRRARDSIRQPARAPRSQPQASAPPAPAAIDWRT